MISCQPPGGLPSQPDVIGATAWPVHAHDASIFSLVARSRSQADAREGSDDRTFVMFVREGDYCFGAVATLVLAIIVLLQRPMIQPSMTFSATASRTWIWIWLSRQGVTPPLVSNNRLRLAQVPTP